MTVPSTITLPVGQYSPTVHAAAVAAAVAARPHPATITASAMAVAGPFCNNGPRYSGPAMSPYSPMGMAPPAAYGSAPMRAPIPKVVAPSNPMLRSKRTGTSLRLNISWMLSAMNAH